MIAEMHVFMHKKVDRGAGAELMGDSAYRISTLLIGSSRNPVSGFLGASWKLCSVFKSAILLFAEVGRRGLNPSPTGVYAFALLPVLRNTY